MTDCIFCGIVAGSTAASVVYSDGVVSAFLDIRPINPGHLLVVPNAHVIHTHDLPDATADRLFNVARRLARALRASDLIRAGGINFLVADGEAANQEVPHAHIHVVPRHDADGFMVDAAAWREVAPTRAELDEVAAGIRAALERGIGEPTVPNTE